jgi:hypothetical protein
MQQDSISPPNEYGTMIKRALSQEWRTLTGCLLFGLIGMPFVLSVFNAMPDIFSYKERVDQGNPMYLKFINDPHNIFLNGNDRYIRFVEFLEDNKPGFKTLSPGEKDTIARKIFRQNVSPLQVRETYRAFYASFWRGYWLLALSPLVVFLLARSVQRSILSRRMQGRV